MLHRTYQITHTDAPTESIASYITAKSICYFDILHLSQELQLHVDQNSPLWQPAVKHTWSTRKADVATRAGKFAKASDKCYTQQKSIVH